MTIRIADREDQAAWNRYVGSSDRSTCYHQMEWKDVIEKSFGHATSYLLSEQGPGNLNGVLPLVQLKSALFGNFMISLPFFNYGGVCADNQEIERELLREAERIAMSWNMEHIELRQTAPLLDSGMQVKTSKVSMRLDLPKDPDDLWKSFSSKLRSQVQRPAKEGMHARFGRESELDGFYTIFARNMRDLGTPVYSKEFFRNILKEFPTSARICLIATKEGTPVAAGFLIGFKGTLEIPWASSLRSHNRFSPNMLLYWNVLRFACEKGYTAFDFGRSTPGEGTYWFKEQWGARPIQLYWHYWMRSGGSMPELNPRNPKYRLAISLWKRMPVWMTKLIGPPIVKNLP